MSAELPCYLGMAEAAAEDAAARSSASAAAAAGAAGGERLQQAAAGLRTFSAHFSSQCEHHLLPFYGKLKLTYLPAPGSSSSGSGDRAALRQIVQMFSKRLQVQERLTHQVADAGAGSVRPHGLLWGVRGLCCVALAACLDANWGGGAAGLPCVHAHALQGRQRLGGRQACAALVLPARSPADVTASPLPQTAPPAVASALGAAAVLVVVESAHMCMVARGVEKHASTTLTTAARGAWADDTAARAAALEALLDQQPHSPRKP